MYQAKESYTPTEARRANDELDRLVAARTLTTSRRELIDDILRAEPGSF